MARHMAQQKVRQKGRSRVPLVVLCVLVVMGALAFVVWRFVLPALHVGSPASDAQDAEVVDVTDGQATGVAAQTLVQTPFTELLQAGGISSIRLVGDSITAGYGTDGYVNADDEGTGAVIFSNEDGEVHFETSGSAGSWANSFRAWAAEQGITNFVNAGINGAFMRGLAFYPDAWLQGGADVIVVALGTNDCGYYGTEEFAADAREALSYAAAASKLVVVLSPVLDLRPADSLAASPSSYGDALAAICSERGYLFCDTRPYVTADLFAADGLHPTTAGSMAIWQALRQTLGI